MEQWVGPNKLLKNTKFWLLEMLQLSIFLLIIVQTSTKSIRFLSNLSKGSNNSIIWLTTWTKNGRYGLPLYLLQSLVRNSPLNLRKQSKDIHHQHKISKLLTKCYLNNFNLQNQVWKNQRFIRNISMSFA
jgi:hypothetical protein